MSALPQDIRRSADMMNLDRNDDGELSIGDLAYAINELENKSRSNKTMMRTLFAILVAMILLVVCVFCATITAERLSKEFTVDPSTGMASSSANNHEKPSVLKTASAEFFKDDISIGELSNDQLDALKTIVLKQGSVKFVIKGYSKDPFGDSVILLVEGGKIFYDSTGIVKATGNAKLLLEAAYGLDAFDTDGSDRMLFDIDMLASAAFTKDQF